MRERTKLTEDLLHTEYIVNKLSSLEIANKYGYDRTYIVKKNKEYNITASMQYESYVVSDLQEDLIIGSILGDGCVTLSKKHKYPNLYISHAENQKRYLEFKYEVMKNLCKMEKILPRKSSGYNVQQMYYFSSRCLPVLFNYHKLSVEELALKLNKNSFLIWLMDDGRLDRETYYTIGCTRYNEYEINELIKGLKINLEIESVIDYNDKNHTKIWGIRFGKEGSKQVKKIIETSDFIHQIKDTMKYKLLP